MKSKRGTDWLSWILQGIAGAVVGTLLGFLIIARRRHGFWLDAGLILPFLTGAALIGLGLGSLVGYKLWDGGTCVFPLDAPRITGFGQALSFLLTSAGIILALVTLGRQFHLV